MGGFLRRIEVDTRLIGMLTALVIAWIVFNIGTGGQFLSARNLWNLSVQTATVAVMATGMVLIIVSRNIDLSVGSMMGLIGMFMALVQTEWTHSSWAWESTTGGSGSSRSSSA